MKKIRIKIGDKVLYEGKMNTVKLPYPKERKRVLFLRWLCRLAKVPEFQLPPKWILVIQYILFPIRTIGLKYTPIKWDPPTNIYEIDGVKISGQVLKFLGRSAKDGEIFKFIKRDLTGDITIRVIEFNDEAIEFGEWLRTFDALTKENGFWVLESQVSTKDLYRVFKEKPVIKSVKLT
jgi:hypothetical protein